MKKYTLSILIVLFLAGVCAAAPPSAPSPWKLENGLVIVPKKTGVSVKFPRYTVANLPSTLDTGDAGVIVQVTDGDDAEDCTTGGGTDINLCYWTGSAWANAGDGTAAGSAEVADATIGAAGNGDTTHAYSKDDIHDWVIGVDPDFSGAIEADELPADALLASEIGAAYDTEAELDALFAAKQGLDADLTAVAALTTDAYGLALLEVADEATLKALINAEAGTDFQAYDAQLTDLADGTLTGDFVNTANPWADNEVADDLTISGGTVNNSIIGGSTPAAITGTTITANTGLVTKNGATSAGYLDIFEDSDDGTNKTRFIAQAQAGDVTYTLPAADGTPGQYLQDSDGSGTLAWATPPGGGDITTVGTCASGDCFVDGSTTSTALVFEMTDNAFETTITVTDPTADRTITFPDATGTVLMADGAGTSLTALNGENIQDDTIDDDSIDFSDITGADLTLTDATTITASGLITASAGLTLATTTNLTVGVVQWDNGSDYIDGEQIADDTIDDDSIDLTDVTLADITFDVGSVDTTEFGYLNGVTSAIQTQLDAKEDTDAEIARFDTADTVGADWEWQDNIAMSFGNDNDGELSWDTDVSDNDGDFTTGLTGGGLVFLFNNAAADEKVIFDNADGTYGVDLYVKDIIYSGNLTYDGSGDSVITLANNASIVGAGYQVFFEGGNLISVENGDEKELLNAEDNITSTATTIDLSSTTNALMPASADAASEIGVDDSTDIFSLGIQDGAGAFISYDYTGVDGNDTYVMAWDEASNKFTAQAQAGGGGDTSWDDLNDPDAGAAAAFTMNGAGETTTFTMSADNTEWLFDYTAAFTVANSPTLFRLSQNTGNAEAVTLLQVDAADSNVIPAKIGNTTDYWQVSQAGVLSNVSAATINIAAANDLLIGGAQIDHDDMAGTAAVTTQGGINLGTGGVVITDDGDGAWTVTGAGDGSDEAITYNHDDVANEIGISSSTGVDNFNFGAIRLETTGDVTGGVLTTSKSANYTLGTDDARESYGGVVYVTSAATITLPAIGDGMSCSVITIGATAVSVDTNASDLMYLDGTALDDGDKATNTSTTGDTLVCTYYSVDGWYCMSGSPDGDHWTDGGP